MIGNFDRKSNFGDVVNRYIVTRIEETDLLTILSYYCFVICLFIRATIISNYFHIIRPKNLAIVAISQFLIYWVYIMPLIGEHSIILDGSLWWLFIVDTVLIAAAGYVINDVFDQQADQLNKPKRTYIGDRELTIKSAWCYYGVLVLVGFMIALFIAYSINKLHLLLIYPTAVGLLFLYSKYFKKLPLIGNFVVSVFCAFVPGIILYAEWGVISKLGNIDPSRYEEFIGFFTAYLVFAFLSTMVREIVKDVEDINGDKESGYRTLPIVKSVKFAKRTAMCFGILLLISYTLWILPYYGTEAAFIVLPFAIFMAILSIVILFQVIVANERSHFAKISKWLKILMVVSLFIFLCIPFLT